MASDYLSLYCAEAPLSFALCRAVECKVLSKTPIEPPILDIGSGDGLFARIFFQGTPLEAGIDISAVEARRAMSAGAYRNVVLSSAAALPFASGSFKTVLSNSVLEHITDLSATLQECCRVLQPHGRIVVTVPLTELSDCFFYSKVLRRFGAAEAARKYEGWKHRVWRHNNVFDADGWRAEFKRAGLRVDDMHLFNSRSTAEVADFLFPISPPSLVFKKLFGRMVLRPVIWSRLMAQRLRRVYEEDGAEGQTRGSVCIVATKASAVCS